MARISVDEVNRSLADGGIQFADRSRRRAPLPAVSTPNLQINVATPEEVEDETPAKRRISLADVNSQLAVQTVPAATEPEAETPEVESRFSADAFVEGAKDLAGAFAQTSNDRFYSAMSRAGFIQPGDPNYVAGVGMDDPFALERVIADRKQTDQRGAEQQARTGFADSLLNPLDAIANEGATGTILRRAVGGLNVDRVNMDYNERVAAAQQEARQLESRMRILQNPEQFPARTVEMAKLAQAEYEAKESKTVLDEAGEAGGALVQAASERPMETLAGLTNALIADPGLALVPGGAGTKPIQAARAAARIAPVIPGTRAAAAVAAADKVLDAAALGGVSNLAVDEIIAADQNRDLTAGQRAASFTIGAGAAGGINALGQIFSRSRSAKEALNSRIDGLNFEELTADVAAEARVVERVFGDPDSFDPTVVNRVNELVGIRPEMSVGEQAVARVRYKKQLEEAFAAADQAKRDAELAANPPEGVLARRVRFSNEFEKALAERGARAAEGAEARVAADAELARMAAKLDEEDIIAEAFESSAGVRQAMERARKRDSRLARPKWQRGSADTELLARVGAAGLFGTAAYALAEDEYKSGSALAAGLAALVFPGGGKVRNIMRQTGAISYSGGDEVPGLNLRRTSDKIAESRGEPRKTVQQVMDEDYATIQQVLAGDQAAARKLYEDYAPMVTAAVRKKGAKIAPRLGMEIEDMAQEVMINIFKSLDSYKPTAPFGAFIQDITSKRVMDYLDKLNAKKRDGELRTSSIFNDAQDFGAGSARSGHIMEGDAPMYNQLADAEPGVLPPGAKYEWSNSYNVTPETAAIRDQAVVIVQNTLDRMNPRMKRAFLEHHENGLSYDEIAELTGQPYNTVARQVQTAEELIAEAVGKGLNARKAAPKVEVAPEIKRGRGRPRKEQAGFIDRDILKAMAAVGGGAVVGSLLNSQNEAFGSDIPPALWGGIIGGAVALGLRGKTLRGQTYGSKLIEGADYTLGVTSTQVKNISEKIWRRAVEFERRTLRDTHKYLEQVAPFVTLFEKLPKESQDVLARAVLTGRGEVTNRILQAIGDRDLIEGWKSTRAALDSLRDQLVALKRFTPTDIEYFPRIVKDVPGLLNAIGANAAHPLTKLLDDAKTKSLTKTGRALSEAEESLIISRYLATEKTKGNQPGFAKNRGVEEITPELQQFYASPIESLNSYIRSAVDDIERAKFFGKDIATIQDGSKLYTNVDQSVGNIVKRLLDEGSLKPEDAAKVGDLLRARFINGDKVPNVINRAARDLTYAGLLGNVGSALVQFGDVALQMYTQGMIPTISAVIKSVTGRKLVDMKDFGLQDHITAELLGQGKTTKILNTVFKLSQFTRVDQFGKNVALNAAIINAARQAKTAKGIAELEAKWGDALQPGELKQLVSDLQKGEVTDLVRSVAFAELSRTQPVSRLEMPPAYLNNPNGRMFYALKTFTIKQIDLARRDVYNQLKAGKIKEAAANMINIAVVMSLGGVSTSLIRDYIVGKDVNLDATDFAFNVLKTYGLSEFYLDRALGVSKEEARARRLAGDKLARQMEANPFRATSEMIMPPVKMFDEIYRADPAAIRYLPVIGPILLQDYREQQEAARGGAR